VAIPSSSEARANIKYELLFNFIKNRDGVFFSSIRGNSLVSDEVIKDMKYGALRSKEEEEEEEEGGGVTSEDDKQFRKEYSEKRMGDDEVDIIRANGDDDGDDDG
jgi:hypothetical protein